MTEDSGLPDKIADWLHESGHALEMRVAREYVSQDAFHVDQSRLYMDTTEGKIQREADVVARWSGVASGGFFSIVSVVECKGSTKKPWVLFHDGSRRFPEEPGTPSVHRMIMRSTVSHLPDQILESWKGLPPFEQGQPACHSVVTAFENQSDDSKGKPNDGPNAAFRAVRQVISACHGLENDFFDSESPNAQVVFTIPSVVTAAPLFRAHLEDSGEVTVERIEHGVLLHRPSGTSKLVAVYLMTESHLRDAFAPSMSRLFETARLQS